MVRKVVTAQWEGARRGGKSLGIEQRGERIWGRRVVSSKGK